MTIYIPIEALGTGPVGGGGVSEWRGACAKCHRPMTAGHACGVSLETLRRAKAIFDAQPMPDLVVRNYQGRTWIEASQPAPAGFEDEPAEDDGATGQDCTDFSTASYIMDAGVPVPIATAAEFKAGAVLARAISQPRDCDGGRLAELGMGEGE
jgi:hypothetical protein